jgi:hypothetical protein
VLPGQRHARRSVEARLELDRLAALRRARDRDTAATAVVSPTNSSPSSWKTCPWRWLANSSKSYGSISAPARPSSLRRRRGRRLGAEQQPRCASCDGRWALHVPGLRYGWESRGAGGTRCHRPRRSALGCAPCANSCPTIARSADTRLRGTSSGGLIRRARVTGGCVHPVTRAPTAWISHSCTARMSAAPPAGGARFRHEPG